MNYYQGPPQGPPQGQFGPPAGQDQWPSQQPGYQQGPPQGYQQPGYQQGPPQGYQQPQQGYGPQGYQQAPQGPPQAPPVQAEKGSLHAFYDQPAVGQGASLSFEKGWEEYFFIVPRDLRDSDAEHSTKMTKPGEPVEYDYFKNGQPKFVLKVPALLAPGNPNYPDGRGVWYCRGESRDKLTTQVRATGARQDHPEGGSAIYVKVTGTRKAGGGFTAKTYDIRYWPPAQAEGLAQQYGIPYPDKSLLAAFGGTPQSEEQEAAGQPGTPAPMGAPDSSQYPVGVPVNGVPGGYQGQSNGQGYAPQGPPPAPPGPPQGQQYGPPQGPPQGQYGPPQGPPPAPPAGPPQGAPGQPQQPAGPVAVQYVPPQPPAQTAPVGSGPTAPAEGVNPELAARMAAYTGQQPTQ